MTDYAQWRVLWSGGAAVAAALALAASTSAGLAGGDGSGSNNPGLLRGGYATACPNAWACDAPVPAARPLQSPSVPSAPIAPEPAALPLQQPASLGPPPVFTPQAPVLDADWRVTLRGTYQQDSQGTRFGVELAPEISIARRAGATQTALTGDARLSKQEGDSYRLSGGALEFDAAHAVNRDTGLGVNLRLEGSQDSPYAPGTASGIAEQPAIVTVSGGLTLERRFGRAGIEIGAEAGREVYGVTRLTSGAVTDNSYRNRLSAGGRVRGLYAATPNLDLYVEGSAERGVHDAVSPGLGVKADSWTYAVRAGVSGNWNEVVAADVSAGYGLRRFDSSLLNDAPTALVAAELTYRPDETLTWSALLGTDISTPEAATGAAARVDYTAELAAVYRINDRVAVRGSLGGEWSRFAGTGDTEKALSAGAGADYTVNRHMTMNADYLYRTTETESAGREDSHRVSLGLTYSR